MLHSSKISLESSYSYRKYYNITLDRLVALYAGSLLIKKLGMKQVDLATECDEISVGRGT